MTIKEVEEIIHKLLNAFTMEDEMSEGVGKLSEEEAIKELTTLIKKERANAVRSFGKWFDGGKGQFGDFVEEYLKTLEPKEYKKLPNYDGELFELPKEVYMNELKKRFEEILNLYITIEKRQLTVFTSDSTSSSEPLGQQVLDQYIVAGIPLAVEALTTEMKEMLERVRLEKKSNEDFMKQLNVPSSDFSYGHMHGYNFAVYDLDEKIKKEGL